MPSKRLLKLVSQNAKLGKLSKSLFVMGYMHAAKTNFHRSLLPPKVGNLGLRVKELKVPAQHPALKGAPRLVGPAPKQAPLPVKLPQAELGTVGGY